MENLRKEGRLKIILQKEDFLLKAFALSKGIDEGEVSGILTAKNFGLIFLTDDKNAKKAAEEEGVKVKGIEDFLEWIWKSEKENNEKIEKEIKLLEKHRYKLKRQLKV